MLAMLAMVGSTFAASGGGGAAFAASKPSKGGTLRYDAQIEIKSWLPYQLGGNAGGEDRGVMVFDTLLLQLPDGSWSPNIASDMKSSDGINWTMTLRPNVKFSDGTPLDADAVVYNVTQIKDPKNGSTSATLVAGVQTMTAVNPTTVNFVLSAVNGDFPSAFTGLPGMMGSPTAMKANATGFGTKPVGAGPFMVDSWVRDSSAKLVRNPTYWDAPKPYLDGITIKILPDASIRAQDLIAGNADVVATDSVVLKAVKDEPGNKFKNLTGASTGAAGVWPNTKVKPFDDVRVRKAIAYAFDYHLVNTSLRLGGWPEEKLVCPPFQPSQDVCDKNAWITPNLKTAKKLIADYKKDGGSIDGTYRLLISTVRVPEGELIQQTLSTIGIKTTIVNLLDADYTAAQVRHDFDLVYSGITPFAGQNPAQFWRNYDPAQRNTAFVDDPELHNTIVTASTAVDEKSRVQAVKKVLAYNKKNFLAIWFAPIANGIAGRSAVVLGPRYSGGTPMVAQDIYFSGKK